MRTNRCMWCVGLIAAVVTCAGAAVAKPEKGETRGRGEKSARMTAVKQEGAEPIKVVKQVTSSAGATKSVEVSREKTDEGVKTTRHTTLTTASGVTVVRDDTRLRESAEKGTSSVTRSGTTVVTDAKGESKTATRSSQTTREGRTVTRMSGMTGPNGKGRSTTTTVVQSDDGMKAARDVTRRSGTTTHRETTRTVDVSKESIPEVADGARDADETK